MPGSIEYTRQVRPIPCDCRTCYHAKISAGVLFCRYYDLIKPQKKSCARYEKMPGKWLGQKQSKKKKKKIKKDISK